MVFSELSFLYVFLPLNLLCYALAKDIRQKNVVQLIFSLVFYAWGEPVYLLLLLGMAFCNWFLALRIGHARAHRQFGKAKGLLVAACVVCLGTIGVFKYGTFFLENLHLLIGFPSKIPEILLPIGISFYTFQILSYVVDVYRGEVPPQRSFSTLLLYVSLFHQCVAGPIVRYQDVMNELRNRKASWKDMSEGLTRFTVGLAKKAVFANHCGEIADQLLASESLSGRSTAALWLAIFAYSLQIYLDFSAYSDMAIGMGKMVGFHYKENFNYPYIANSVTEFWRRWHMSLSSFFRDYVYIPLGGNRCKRGRQIFNMFIVWLLTGFWHGASWNYVIWGLYFFVFLVIEKTLLSKLLERLPRVVGHLYLLIVVFFGWAIFRMENLGELWSVLSGLFGFGGRALSDTETSLLFMNNWAFFAVAVVACTPLVKKISAMLKKVSLEYEAMYVVDTVLRTVLPIVLLLVATAMLVGNQYNPFIYFQF